MHGTLVIECVHFLNLQAVTVHLPPKLLYVLSTADPWCLVNAVRLQDRDGASAVRTALRGGKWLLVDSDARGVLAEPGQQHVVPIKSVRGPGLRLDLFSEMGDDRSV